MSRVNRRDFMGGLIISGAVASGAAAANPVGTEGTAQGAASELSKTRGSIGNRTVDFRYAPRHSQSTICFPDDPNKTVLGQAGDLRYGFAKALTVGMEDFATVVEFSLAGFQDDRVIRQWIEGPGVPIVHTLIDRPSATLELTAFASRHSDEGRVDNVLLSIKSKRGGVAVAPKIRLRACDKLELEDYDSPIATVL